MIGEMRPYVSQRRGLEPGKCITEGISWRLCVYRTSDGNTYNPITYVSASTLDL